MKRHLGLKKQIVSALLITAVSCSVIPLSAQATPGAGVFSTMHQTTQQSSSSPMRLYEGVVSGASLDMLPMLQDSNDELQEGNHPVAVVAAVETIEDKTIGVDPTTLAVADVDTFVYVRSEPSETGEVLGKLYTDGVGTVIEETDGWVHIQSGSVDGYVSSDFVTIGDPQRIEDATKYLASVNADGLRVRSDMSTESSIIEVARNGEQLVLADTITEDPGWIKVESDATEGDAYVSSEYVDVSVDYTYAESREEEAARLERERSQLGVDVCNYALQFVGNPYVWGGTSLTRGADCSGFVMSVYQHFGVSLPHSSAADRGVGRGVSVDEMRPGDLVCYSGHVALYIGNGQIVHAASRRSGIKVSSAFYRKILAVRRIF